MRERTKYAIRAALGILVGMPVTWFGSYYVVRKLGLVAEKPPLFHVISIMVLFCSFAIYNFVTYDEDSRPSR